MTTLITTIHFLLKLANAASQIDILLALALASALVFSRKSKNTHSGVYFLLVEGAYRLFIILSEIILIY